MNDFIKDNFWTLALIHAILTILWFVSASAYDDDMTDSPLFWLFVGLGLGMILYLICQIW